MTKITSKIMRDAAALLVGWPQTGRHYYVCFAVKDSADVLRPAAFEARAKIRDELEALLRRDRINTDGTWFIDSVCTWNDPGYVEAGPERQKLRADWCLKIADELEEQELLALALQTR